MVKLCFKNTLTQSHSLNTIRNNKKWLTKHVGNLHFSALLYKLKLLFAQPSDSFCRKSQEKVNKKCFASFF